MTDNFSDAVTVVILAGGLSRRMGQDKLFLDVGGVPLFERVLQPMQQLFRQVVVIANERDPFRYYSFPVYQDIYPGSALGGLFTGLFHAKTHWTFVSAGDLPFVNVEVVNYLLSLASDCDVVVPYSEKGAEPLFACYAKSCLPVMEQALKNSQFKIVDLFDTLTVCHVPFSQLADIRGIENAFINLNCLEDLSLSNQLLISYDSNERIKLCLD